MISTNFSLPTLKLPLLSATSIALFIILLWILTTSSPLQGGPSGVLLVFALLYGFVTSVLYLGTYIIYKAVALITQRQLPVPKWLYPVVSIVALAPIFMIALNTLGQLGLVEILLVLLLIAIASFYTIRRGP